MNLALAFLALLQGIAYYYLWRTNRRLDAVTIELREEIEASRREMEGMYAAMSRHVDEIAEEMRERIRAANRKLDETIETNRLMEELNDRTAHCLRAPDGMSKRIRRSDHRQ